MIEENLARLRAYRKHSPLRAVGRDATLGPGEDLHRKAAGGRTGRSRSSRQNDISLQSAGAWATGGRSSIEARDVSARSFHYPGTRENHRSLSATARFLSFPRRARTFPAVYGGRRGSFAEVCRRAIASATARGVALRGRHALFPETRIPWCETYARPRRFCRAKEMDWSRMRSVRPLSICEHGSTPYIPSTSRRQSRFPCRVLVKCRRTGARKGGRGFDD